MAEQVIAVDLADVYENAEGGSPVRTLAWGDRVEVLDRTPNHLKVRTRQLPEQPDGSVIPEALDGYLRGREGTPPEDSVGDPGDHKVLRVDFVDVQQGDAAVIETPAGRVILIDGGDNQLFARYLAARFPDTDRDHPKDIDCILVSHGDADHFLGLTEIHESETHETASKRLFIRPHRVFHNGLVRRVADREVDELGETEELGEETVIVELEEDLLAVENMSSAFERWREVLADYDRRSPIEFKRLAQGGGEEFAFVADEDIEVEVLGPIETGVGGKPGLRFLGNPPKKPIVSHPQQGIRPYGGRSASHTINGHSVVMRVRLGDVRFLFAGDLNEQAAEALSDAYADDEPRLRSEVFKVPHHGSADFSHDFFRAVEPLVSVVSSGDESARKEYVHPRATLMTALGRHGRSQDSVLFVTELVAFFAEVGWAYPTKKRGGDPDREHDFYGFRRAAWGLVKVRTDGRRLLVYTSSASARLNEAYAFEMEAGTPKPVRVVEV